MRSIYKRRRLKNHAFIPDGVYKAHRVVMMEKLGRLLDKVEVVHHIDEDKYNNDPENLQLFPNSIEHLNYHRRMRAIEACGNPDAYKCGFCKEYDILSNMSYNIKSNQAHHVTCINAYQQERNAKRREWVEKRRERLCT